MKRRASTDVKKPLAQLLALGLLEMAFICLFVCVGDLSLQSFSTIFMNLRHKVVRESDFLVTHCPYEPQSFSTVKQLVCMYFLETVDTKTKD